MVVSYLGRMCHPQATPHLSFPANGCLNVSIVKSLMTAELRSLTLLVPRRIRLKLINISFLLFHFPHLLVRTGASSAGTLALGVEVVVLSVSLARPVHRAAPVRAHPMCTAPLLNPSSVFNSLSAGCGTPLHWWTEWAPAWGYIPAKGAGEEDTL